MPDAVVIGAGPNGLVAANVLADAGWDVVVLEAAAEPGGAVRSDREASPEFVSDTFSAFYPLAAASPVLQALDLAQHGLVWSHAPTVLAHQMGDGSVARLSRDPHETAADLDRLTPGDGAAWLRLYGLWERVGDHVLQALVTPFPPVRAGCGLLRELGVAGLLRFARFGVLPVRRVGEEEFRGAGATMLLAGNTQHADLAPESAASGLFGWLLAMLGQQHGFPVPKGGAGQLTAALVRRLESGGGRVVCGTRVQRVVVRRGRAVAVLTSSGDTVDATRAVVADVAAPHVYGGLVGWEHLPVTMRDDLRRFQWGYGTFKVDWALDAPVPWQHEGLVGAGTVHLADDLDHMSRYSSSLAIGRLPPRPFVLVGQLSTADPTRSPTGTESLYAYTHVPRTIRGDDGGDAITDAWTPDDAEALARRLEARIEEFAPGFRRHILGRRILTPRDMERRNSNLVGGAINGGTSHIHQQLFFRPVPGWGRPETPVPGLYLASASAHPGGGVHGACGANAARAALRAQRRLRRVLTAPAIRTAEHVVRP